MRKNAKSEASCAGEKTLENVKWLFPNARNMKMEYHSMNDEERQGITKWILNLNNTLAKVLSVFMLVADIAILICGYLGISDVNTNATFYLMTFSVCSIIIWGGTFCFLPRRNKRILESIDFDNVQECIFSRIVSNYRGISCYVILQWDAEAQKFYEVEYRDSFPNWNVGDILYHPYGTKFYIPKKKILTM